MQNQAPKLVIMAAGMGSRFGGLKQMEPVDKEGHSIIDFSMYDARRAGFCDLVFIIKREHDALFRERIGNRMERFFNVEYVYQELTDIPAGCTVPDGRVKPWGTGQAIACCRNVLHGPFAVINSDDFYGRTAFSEIYEFLRTNDDEHCYAMVGYRVRNTVTEFGSVARGVCEVQNGMLMGITERTKIYQRGDHAAYTEDGEHFVDLPGDTIVSMNIWGFTQPTVSEFWTRLGAFFEKEVPLDPLKREFYLPSVVNQQLEEGTARVRVLPCEEVWHGVTYREDLASVKEAICALKAAGVYEERLWPD
jgi:NDP-sugar pyrophosphorylase family protein